MKPEIEMERVFTLKQLPADLHEHPSIFIKIADMTLTNDFDCLKVRGKGDDFEIIKKEYIDEQRTKEYRILLKEDEFEKLYAIGVRKHEKIRYFYKLGEYTCEIDVYLGILQGYVRAEVEFDDLESYERFKAPDWFADEITDINHVVHENLGNVSFAEMKERYVERGLSLNEL